jgi:Protein of unknown function (DUF2934)
MPEKKSSTTSPAESIADLICKRAYDIYEQRGGEHGHDLEDWLKAEAEIIKEQSNVSPVASKKKAYRAVAA